MRRTGPVGYPEQVTSVTGGPSRAPSRVLARPAGLWAGVGPVPGAPLPAYALREVGAVAVALVAVLLALAGRYGYHRDELYFRQLSDSPAWGYVDQPPLTPLLARGAIALLGDSVWSLRVPAAVLLGGLALLLALLARELGGRRKAQVVAALGAAGAGPLISGHLLLTASLDWPLWVLTAWLVCRAVLRGEPRVWLLAGAVAGLGLYNKHLVLLLLLALAAGLLVSGPRRLLGTRWPWLAALVAVVVGSPNLLYQVVHGLPQLQMAGSLTGAAARWVFVPGQLLSVGPPGAVVWGAGLVALWRSPRLRPVRAFGTAYVVAAVLLLLVAGQFYYTTGFLLVLYAVGSVAAERWLEQVGGAARRLRTVRLRRLLVINVVTSALVALPLLPASVLALSPVPLLNPAVGDQVGWPRYVAQVAEVVDALPPGQRARTVLVAENYGEAGALDRYGPDLDLPPVVSGHNALHELARPAEGATTAVVLVQGHGQGHVSEELLRRSFGSCTLEARLDNGVGVANEEQGTAVVVCTDPVATWAELWPDFAYVGLSTFCQPCRRLGL